MKARNCYDSFCKLQYFCDKEVPTVSPATNLVNGSDICHSYNQQNSISAGAVPQTHCGNLIFPEKP